MPTRNAGQRIGKIGERAIETLIDDHSRWVARRQDADFGIDLEAELAEPGPDGQELRGQLLTVQVKAGAKPTNIGSHVKLTVDRAWIEYACEFRMPVIAVAATSDGKQAWWVWVQEWALLNERRLAAATGATITLRLPAEQTLATGLDHDLAEIATGRHPAAMVLALRGVLAVASGWENARIAQGIVELLGRTAYPSRDWTTRMIVDQLSAAGPNVFYRHAQQYIPILLALVKTAGDALTRDDVLHLVQRGEVYSRVGIDALSVLYDEWPEHAASLGLPEAFGTAGLDPAAWYAAMRECFPGQRNFGMFLADQPEGDLVHDGATLRIDQDLRDHLKAKWPNRGESVLLDCLFWPARPGAMS
jgi:hypothetical protein